MAKRVIRVGDKVQFACVRGGTVISGTGSVVQGSPDVSANGSPVARDGDRVQCGGCGSGRIQATGENLCNGTPIAVDGDEVILDGGGKIYAYVVAGDTDVSTD